MWPNGLRKKRPELPSLYNFGLASCGKIVLMNDSTTSENVDAKGPSLSPQVTIYRHQTVRIRTLSNRHYVRLEPLVTHRKQTTGPISNRHKITKKSSATFGVDN